jgi:hypothetical protein
MGRAELRVTECRLTVSAAERSEQEATERARDATDADTFAPQAGTAEAEKSAWEQVQKAKQRAQQAIQANAEATKLLTRRQDKVKQLQTKLEDRLQTARRTGEAAVKRKPNRVFLLIEECAHWWLVEIERATRTVYQHDGFNSSDTDIAQRVLSWWTEMCEHDLPTEDDCRKWKIRCAVIPRQPNAVDCGPFACAALRRLLMVGGRPPITGAGQRIATEWGFEPMQGPAIRYKMATELRQGKLVRLEERDGGETEMSAWMTW